jgi:hypothetical protein
MGVSAECAWFLVHLADDAGSERAVELGYTYRCGLMLRGRAAVPDFCWTGE